MTADMLAGLCLGLMAGIACYELGLSLAEQMARRPELLRERRSALPRRRW